MRMFTRQQVGSNIKAQSLKYSYKYSKAVILLHNTLEWQGVLSRGLNFPTTAIHSNSNMFRFRKIHYTGI